MKRFSRILIFLLLFLVILANFFFYAYTLRERLKNLREKAVLIASSAALSIDVDALTKIPLRRDGDKAEEYQNVFRQLEKVKRFNPSVKYAYIMAATEDPGILQYIVDADPLPAIATAKSPTAFPGDKYDARNIPAMLAAYNGPIADKDLIADDWGMTISGYAPIYNNEGKVVAILGADIDGSWVAESRKTSRIMLFSVLIMGICLTVVFLRFRQPHG